MRIYHEESFGPVVSVIRVDDAEQALSIANDTDYGLSAASSPMICKGPLTYRCGWNRAWSMSMIVRSRMSRMYPSAA
jgi:hypothetical protein